MWKYYALRLAYLLLARLPMAALYGIALVVGDGAYFLRSDAREAVCANMRQVMGPEASERDVHRAAREVFRNATRYYADLLHIARMDVARFRRERLDLHGEEYLREAERSGRGAVIASTHFGNPEMAVQGLAAEGFLITGITEPLEPQELSDFIDRLRTRHGHSSASADFGGLRTAIARIKSGGLVAVLFDRDVLGTGVPMPFCGAQASIPLGAVDIALRTNCDLLPAWSSRLPGRRFRVDIGPPLELVRTGDSERDLRANGARLLALFEERLRKDPGQWAVLERIWAKEPQQQPAASGALQ
ncbi:MAG: lysophospholipid acyltransferase family protein [Dehalococcoidia bacterium]